MTLALVDCPTGLAGNMLLAALFDLGLPEAVVEEPLQALGLQGRYRIELEERRSGVLRGLHLDVRALEPDPPHRHWRDLRRLIAEAAVEERLRQRLLAVFGLLAEAEASVHGQESESVHFHEVGAVDALVDIVGVCAALLHFGVDRLICGVPPAGHGNVMTQHGHLPLPAPAVLEIARRRAIPLATSEGFPAGELTTPTGLALMAGWAERFGPAPAHLPRAVGVGLGSRSLDRPNLLRLVLAEPVEDSQLGAVSLSPQPISGQPPAEQRQSVLEQQCLIDDASGEDLAFLSEALRQAGAVEVFHQPVSMKKGRPGVLLTALAAPGNADALRAVWWRHSTTLGIRECLQPRWVLERASRTLETPLGPVRLKLAQPPGGAGRHKFEHDDLAALARRHGLPLAEVRQQAEDALREEQAARPAQPPPRPLPDPSP
jgi:hypothetical protein